MVTTLKIWDECHMQYTAVQYELKVQIDPIDRFWEMILNDESTIKQSVLWVIPTPCWLDIPLRDIHQYKSNV
jgi:hypothetical protein